MNIWIPFEGLYSEAATASERLALLILAKLYHIRHENFAEAVRYRRAEKALREQIDAAAQTVGAELNSVLKEEETD